jgi:hypothetical protein
MRRVTRTAYSVSSLVPRRTWSAMLTAAISSEASSASPKLPTCTSSGSRRPASRRRRASATRTSRKPVTSMKGRRSAARIGGSSALSTARSAATRNAAPVCSSEAPGVSHIDTSTAAAATIQPSRRRATPRRGASACQRTGSPYGTPVVSGEVSGTGA